MAAKTDVIGRINNAGLAELLMTHPAGVGEVSIGGIPYSVSSVDNFGAASVSLNPRAGAALVYRSLDEMVDASTAAPEVWAVLSTEANFPFGPRIEEAQDFWSNVTAGINGLGDNVSRPEIVSALNQPYFMGRYLVQMDDLGVLAPLVGVDSAVIQPRWLRLDTNFTLAGISPDSLSLRDGRGRLHGIDSMSALSSIRFDTRTPEGRLAEEYRTRFVRAYDGLVDHLSSSRAGVGMTRVIGSSIGCATVTGMAALAWIYLTIFGIPFISNQPSGQSQAGQTTTVTPIATAAVFGTPKPYPSYSPTKVQSPTPPVTATPTQFVLPVFTGTPTATPTGSATATAVSTGTSTATQTSTVTQTPSRTPSATPTLYGTASPAVGVPPVQVTGTPASTGTPSSTATSTYTVTPGYATGTATVSATSTSVVSPTVGPQVTVTYTSTPVPPQIPPMSLDAQIRTLEGAVRTEANVGLNKELFSVIADKDPDGVIRVLFGGQVSRSLLGQMYDGVVARDNSELVNYSDPNAGGCGTPLGRAVFARANGIVSVYYGGLDPNNPCVGVTRLNFYVGIGKAAEQREGLIDAVKLAALTPEENVRYLNVLLGK
ncbi:hypothetical protein HY640_00690 [Candidatus Woesearchaeota archaeon]|nr:hypothetical protein [Candidatus Woesearchaeota archaeon]